VGNGSPFVSGITWLFPINLGVGRVFAGIGLLARLSAAFRNLSVFPEKGHTPFMPYAPQTEFRERAERVGFDEKTPVVVRFAGGVRCSAQLQVVSVTGGLLCLQRPVQPGAVGKLMFLTSKGCITGDAQMLVPVAWDRQPFKFTTLHEDDRYKLQTIIKRQRSAQPRQNQQRGRERLQFENVRAW
jgi:hypothetical protein